MNGICISCMRIEFLPLRKYKRLKEVSVFSGEETGERMPEGGSPRKRKKKFFKGEQIQRGEGKGGLI